MERTRYWSDESSENGKLEYKNLECHLVSAFDDVGSQHIYFLLPKRVGIAKSRYRS